MKKIDNFGEFNESNQELSDLQFALNIIEEKLNQQNDDLLDYMNKHMTQEERNRHGDNIYSYLLKYKSLKSWINMNLMANGRAHL